MNTKQNATVTVTWRDETVPTYVEGQVFEPGFYAVVEWRDEVTGNRVRQPAGPGATWSEALANLAEQLKMKGR